MKRPAIFLDRDGTLVEEVNYLHRPEETRLFAGTKEALALLKDAGFALVVVTNQSGIGRGIYTVDDMERVHTALQHELGGIIDAFYHCPHLPCDSCECRKPGLKMIRDAERDLDLDIENSWIVGDKKIDVEAGQAAGMATVLVLTGYGISHRETLDQEPKIIAADIAEAAREILRLLSPEVIL
ncbi:MAG TPA: HAD family hydrolase [Pyrinomonadaceae bacterium]|nr:HAD family hydrolase [Pyrinomonadaceae bacterium]